MTAHDSRDSYELPDEINAACPNCRQTIDAIWISEMRHFIRWRLARDIPGEEIVASARAVLVPLMTPAIDPTLAELVAEALVRRELAARR